MPGLVLTCPVIPAVKHRAQGRLQMSNDQVQVQVQVLALAAVVLVVRLNRRGLLV